MVCICRPLLQKCGVCRVPFQKLERHRCFLSKECIEATIMFIMLFRYAERDHEQLVALCRQRTEIGQKLAKKSNQTQVEEGPTLEPAVQEETIQIFVKMVSSPNRTIVLKVKLSTPVRKVKEMVEAKEGGVPVARQRLQIIGGKSLCQEELTLAEYGVGKEETLICFVNHMEF